MAGPKPARKRHQPDPAPQMASEPAVRAEQPQPPRVAPGAGLAFGDTAPAKMPTTIRRYTIKPVDKEELKEFHKNRHEKWKALDKKERVDLGREEMAQFRGVMERDDRKAEREADLQAEKGGPVTAGNVDPRFLRASYSAYDDPKKPGQRNKPGSDEKFDAKKRAFIDAALRHRRLPDPRVGISNRPGFDDSTVFAKAGTTDKTTSGARVFPGLPIASAYLPQGSGPTARGPKDETGDQKAAREQAEKERIATVQQLRGLQSGARDAADKPDISGVSGIFIPGGQDREKDASPEKVTREAYEQALVYQARQLGMPVLAVCGGSRSLARGFGAEEETLPNREKKVHKTEKTQAHPVVFNDPHTILGGAAGGRQNPVAVDAMNSTHEKVIATRKDVTRSQKKNVPDVVTKVYPEFSPVNMLPSGPSEIVVSAQDPTGYPEGFETRYGAPIVGVTSHPELIFGTSTARDDSTAQGVAFSDNVLKGFRQSMQAYDAKKRLHPEVTGAEPKLRATAEGVATRLETIGQRLTALTDLKLVGLLQDDLRKCADQLDSVQALTEHQEARKKQLALTIRSISEELEKLAAKSGNL